MRVCVHLRFPAAQKTDGFALRLCVAALQDNNDSILNKLQETIGEEQGEKVSSRFSSAAEPFLLFPVFDLPAIPAICGLFYPRVGRCNSPRSVVVLSTAECREKGEDTAEGKAVRGVEKGG